MCLVNILFNDAINYDIFSTGRRPSLNYIIINIERLSFLLYKVNLFLKIILHILLAENRLASG